MEIKEPYSNVHMPLVYAKRHEEEAAKAAIQRLELFSNKDISDQYKVDFPIESSSDN